MIGREQVTPIEEQLAIAVLRGDKAAAYALVDVVLESRQDSGIPSDDDIRRMRENHPAPLGHDVYHWPEFRSFAKRLGYVYEHYTLDTNIYIPLEGFVEIDHCYRGLDTQRSRS